MDTIRLMIVDDREEICREMSTAIELITASASPAIEVIATASDGLDAIEKADACKPDLILMDLEMPNLGGLSASQRIKAKHPDIIIMAFTIHDSPATRLAVTQAKMDGLISKGLSLSKIVEEIERRYSKRNY
jgi:two-component system, NarL family, nitrate/nitrite response regulator NarL